MYGRSQRSRLNPDIAEMMRLFGDEFLDDQTSLKLGIHLYAFWFHQSLLLLDLAQIPIESLEALVTHFLQFKMAYTGVMMMKMTNQFVHSFVKLAIIQLARQRKNVHVGPVNVTGHLRPDHFVDRIRPVLPFKRQNTVESTVH